MPFCWLRISSGESDGVDSEGVDRAGCELMVDGDAVGEGLSTVEGTPPDERRWNIAGRGCPPDGIG